MRTRAAWPVLIILGWAAVCTSAEPTKDSLDTVKEKLEKKTAILLDVREKAEWDAGHLKQAVLVPLSRLRNGVDKVKFEPGTTIYCHCRAGRRALVAADILRDLGYDVRPLKQGYEDLLKAGFPVADKKN